MQNRVKQTFKIHTYYTTLVFTTYLPCIIITLQHCTLNLWKCIFKSLNLTSNQNNSNCAAPIDFTCFKILRPQCKNAIVFHGFFRFSTENMFAACMSIFSLREGTNARSIYYRYVLTLTEAPKTLLKIDILDIRSWHSLFLTSNDKIDRLIGLSSSIREETLVKLYF